MPHRSGHSLLNSRRYRAETQLVLLTLLLAVAVFVFFKSFFDSAPNGFTVEILAAVLGCIMTVIITMMLIRRQGSIEQAREAAAVNKTRIFEKKLELFREFISAYVRSAFNGELDCGELGRLEELALTISLFTREDPQDGQEDLSDLICRFVLQLEAFGLSKEIDPGEEAMYDSLFPSKPGAVRELLTFDRVVARMKSELGVSAAGIDEEDRESYERDHPWMQSLLDYRVK
jgi:hypothetical protein